jgi:heat shock protein HslJ/uncharacterized membrane protein
MHWKRIIFLAILLVDCSPPKDTSKVSTTNPKSSLVMSPTALLEKSVDGIDFVAHGNDPDWMLDINFDNTMIFRSARGTYHAPASKSIRGDAKVNRYFSNTDETDFIVTLTEQACTDKWNNKFDLQVKVEVKYPREENLLLYEGCGKYLPDYRLHNIWVVTILNGKHVMPQDSPRGLPEIEVNASDNRVMGHGGCNSFSGKVEVKGSNITFGPLVSTKMACPGLSVETDFLNLLSESALTYQLESGALHLFKESQEVLVLKNAD